MAVADYDGDRRLDLLLASFEGASLFRKLDDFRVVSTAHWLEVTLLGLTTCTSFGLALWSRLPLAAGACEYVAHASSGSLSPHIQQHHCLLFGLGNYSVVDEVQVV